MHSEKNLEKWCYGSLATQKESYTTAAVVLRKKNCKNSAIQCPKVAVCPFVGQK